MQKNILNFKDIFKEFHWNFNDSSALFYVF